MHVKGLSMNKLILTVVLTLCAELTAYAQPAINAGGMLNAASYAYQGLPNSSIAQGSIFVVFGTNMGGSLAQAAFPLPTALDDGTGKKTSVDITVNGTTVHALMIYTTATQLAAVMPSNAPIGTGTMTVTYNGQVSATQPVKVVKSSVGIIAINQGGSGPAVVTDANYKVITQTNPARPGQVLIIWATGAGPVTFDETRPPTTAVNLQSQAKAHVLVGGTDVTPSFVGRSGCCSGLDQIIFTVPQNVSGCYVSVAVQTDDPVVSNFGTIAVAPTGNATCSDPNGLSAQDFATLQSTGKLRSGFVSVGRSTFTTPSISGLPATTTTTDTATGIFSEYQLSTFEKSRGLFSTASIGSCMVFSYSGQTVGTDPIKARGLDAGTLIDLGGGGLSTQLTQMAGFPGLYSANIQGDPIAAGQLITWTGGDPNGTVQIIGSSSSGIEPPIVGGFFTCTEKNSAKQFNIPSAVLLTLPPEAAGSLFPFGFLSVGSSSQLVKFTATGLDFGFAIASDSTGKSVSYK
jgi:uncharacterized protein (TIGR03437 family)